MRISHEFVKTLTHEEMLHMIFEGEFNADTCARLWRMERRPGKPPKSLKIYFDQDDVERLISQIKNKH